MSAKLSRQEFLQFMGRATVGLASASLFSSLGGGAVPSVSKAAEVRISRECSVLCPLARMTTINSFWLRV